VLLLDKRKSEILRQTQPPMAQIRMFVGLMSWWT